MADREELIEPIIEQPLRLILGKEVSLGVKGPMKGVELVAKLKGLNNPGLANAILMIQKHENDIIAVEELEEVTLAEDTLLLEAVR